MTKHPRHDPAAGRRLKELRLKAGLTQTQLAAPRYTKAYISALENGLIRFSVAAGTFLAERLGTTISYLLEGDPFTEVRAKIEALPTVFYDVTTGQKAIDRRDVLTILGGPS